MFKLINRCPEGSFIETQVLLESGKKTEAEKRLIDEIQVSLQKQGKYLNGIELEIRGTVHVIVPHASQSFRTDLTITESDLSRRIRSAFDAPTAAEKQKIREFNTAIHTTKKTKGTRARNKK